MHHFSGRSIAIVICIIKTQGVSRGSIPYIRSANKRWVKPLKTNKMWLFEACPRISRIEAFGYCWQLPICNSTLIWYKNESHLNAIRCRLMHCAKVYFVSSCSWPTRGHLGNSTGMISNPVVTLSAGGPNGCLDHGFRALQAAYTAQLLTLHQHRANNQYRTANQI